MPRASGPAPVVVSAGQPEVGELAGRDGGSGAGQRGGEHRVAELQALLRHPGPISPTIRLSQPTGRRAGVGVLHRFHRGEMAAVGDGQTDRLHRPEGARLPHRQQRLERGMQTEHGVLGQQAPVGTPIVGRALAYPGSPCGTTSDRPSDPPRRLSTTRVLEPGAPYAVAVKMSPTMPETATPPSSAPAPARKRRRETWKSSQLMVISSGVPGCSARWRSGATARQSPKLSRLLMVAVGSNSVSLAAAWGRSRQWWRDRAEGGTRCRRPCRSAPGPWAGSCGEPSGSSRSTATTRRP